MTTILFVRSDSTMDADDQSAASRWRRIDQRTFALATAAALAALAGAWLLAGGGDGTLVEFDQQPHGQAMYRIDLNTADWAELAELPGIGERLARRIVESRDTEGPFQSHDDLRRIRGVGKVTMESVRPHLRPIEK